MTEEPVGPTGQPPRLLVEYEGETYAVAAGRPFDIGRVADLCLDNNPYLHRRFLRIVHEQGFWWIVNIGKGMGASVHDQATSLRAWLGPSSRLPLGFSRVEVSFTAGPCAYELVILNQQLRSQDGTWDTTYLGDTTLRDPGWTPAQRLALLALTEPMLRGAGRTVQLPSNAAAADRIGWTVKRFEKKIDNICDKLDRLGVDGLKGGRGQHASGRRSVLVEWATSTGFVTDADLGLLDHPESIADDD